MVTIVITRPPHLSTKWLQLVAHVEAVIDFGEDENIEDGVLDGGDSEPSATFLFFVFTLQ